MYKTYLEKLLCPNAPSLVHIARVATEDINCYSKQLPPGTAWKSAESDEVIQRHDV